MSNAQRAPKVKRGENYDLFLHVAKESDLETVRSADREAANSAPAELGQQGDSAPVEMDLDVQAALLSALERRGVLAIKALQADTELWARLGAAVGLAARMKAQAYAMARQGLPVIWLPADTCQLDAALKILNQYFVDVDCIPMRAERRPSVQATVLGA